MGLKVRNIIQKLSALFAVVGFVLILVKCSSEPTLSDEHAMIQTDGVYLNLHDTVSYVGMEMCKTCHSDIHSTFIHTGMGLSFDKASRNKSSSKLDENSVLHDEFNNLYYHPYWKGDSLFLLEYRLDDKDTVYQRTEHVDYIIGSGQHTNSHIFNFNGYLHQLPFTYYTQDGKLDFPPGFEDGNNTRFGRKIGLECMSCHNSLPELVFGSENKYEMVPNGISCERCHGPGEIHVREKMAGNIVDTSKYIDYTIVNPAKLDGELQFEVCQRCHLQGNAVLKEGKSFFDFKPGMRLSDVMTVFMPRYEGGENEFIMASHVDRMKQSECYMNSYGGFNCTSCHNPHYTVAETRTEQFNKPCMECHQDSKGVLCTEDPEIRAMQNDNCSGCHMPASTSIDIPHVTVHDHKIRIPGEHTVNPEVEKVRKFMGLKPINETNPDDRTMALGYLQQYEKFTPDQQMLDSAQVYIDRLGNPFELEVYLRFLREDYTFIAQLAYETGVAEVLKMFNDKSWSNTDSWTLYRVAESMYNTGEFNNANRLYQKAVDLAPFNLEFRNKWAVTLVQLGQWKEAMFHLNFAIEEYPLFEEAYVNRGYLYLLEGKGDLALADYRKALSLNPDYVRAMVNMAGYYALAQDWVQAEKWLEKALEADPENLEAQAALIEVRNRI
jgi:predicted CXXCH cytochrome family protein